MKAMVVGAGFAGLGAVSELRGMGASFEVLEAAEGPGGLATTDVVDGFLFDRTGHFLHARSDRFRDLLDLIPVEMTQLTRRSAVVVGNELVPYPIQFNLWALPAATRRQALTEIEDRREPVPPDGSFAEVLKAAWGDVLTDTFFRPYNEKLWCRPLEALPGNCGGRFLPSCDVNLVRAGTLRPVLTAGYNPELLYPKSGRIGEVADALAVQLGASVEYNSAVTCIDAERRVLVVGGQDRHFDVMVTTVPLPRLLDLCGMRPRSEELALRFEHTDVLNLRVGFRGKITCSEHWLYVPDPAIPFYRVGFPSNVNTRSCPPGCASLSLEYGLPPGGKPAATTRALADQAVQYLVDRHMIEVQEVIVRQEYRITPGYVLAGPAERARVDELLAHLRSKGVYSAGRYGAWDYFSMEDSFLSGADAARRALSERPAVKGG